MDNLYSAKDAKADCIRNHYKHHDYESLDQVLNIIEQIVYLSGFSDEELFKTTQSCMFHINKEKIDDAKNTAITLGKLGYNAYVLDDSYSNDGYLSINWAFVSIERFVNEIKDSDPELANEFSKYIIRRPN